MENWLPIAVGVLCGGMILSGHYRGFIRQAVSMAALLVTLVVVDLSMPYVTDYLKNSTFVYQAFETGVKNATGVNEQMESSVPAQQRMIIESLNLPEQIEEALLENNNTEIYEILGVDRFTDYISGYLTNAFINIVGFLVTFLAVYFLIRLFMRWADLIARLPILSGINQLAGAALGALEGLIILWILCLIVTVFAATDPGREIMSQINNSMWLKFIYDHNILSMLVAGVIKGFL